MLDGAGGFGEKAEHVAGLAPALQEAALLGFPQDGDGVDGFLAAHEGGEALPQVGVQGLGEVLGQQPPYGFDVGGVGGGGREQQLLLLDRFGVVGHDGRRGGRGAGQDAGAWREAARDVVHERGERVGLGEHRLDGVREGGVVDPLDEVVGGGP